MDGTGIVLRGGAKSLRHARATDRHNACYCCSQTLTDRFNRKGVVVAWSFCAVRCELMQTDYGRSRDEQPP